MDPHASDPSLQKTSPLMDPAAVYQLTSEVSAQAAMLTSHQPQLQRLTSVTEELVKTLQALRLTTPSAYPPVPEPQPISANLNISTANPRLSFPEKFDGFPDKCKGFLLRCSLFMNQQPLLYTTDNSRVSFICSLLTGRALDWATFVNFERCSSTLLVAKRQANNCSRSVKGKTWQLTTLSLSAPLQPRPVGVTVP